MKKKIIIIISIILIISLIFTIIYKTNDQFRFKLSYEYINLVDYDNGKKIKVNIPYNNHIKYLENDEIITFLTKKTGIIYFGYNTCPWCRNIVEPLIETINKNHINNLYYVDVNKGIKGISNKLLEILDSTLDQDNSEKKGLNVPAVYFVKNGKIVCHHIGTIDGYNNPYKSMTTKQQNELKKIYERGIEAINNG